MDYKNSFRVGLVLFFCVFTVLQGCNTRTGKSKNKVSLFYIEILNGDDSVKTELGKAVFGKLSFLKDNRMTVVSKNFMTDEFPDADAYEPVNSLPAKIEPGTKKITVEFIGNFTVDSTYYAVRQFAYKNDQWTKISDIGFVKAEPRYQSEPLKNKMPVKDLVSTVTSAITESTHSR